MRRTFIKKEGVVITTLARYLLGEKCGNRLKTIDELATCLLYTSPSPRDST
ncbi:hypothetical protein ACX3VG_20335, partial [Escherichia coli]